MTTNVLHDANVGASPTRPEVLVIRTGSANLASVLVGLERVGASPRVTEDPREVAEATALVLPGVGSFGAAMAQLRRGGLAEPIKDYIQSGRPLLAICLGLQLLCRDSEESPGVVGLDIVPLTVRRFPTTVRVPQLGWNQVEPALDGRVIETGHAYFANSYCLSEVPAGWSCSMSEHGGKFVAAMVRGDVHAFQFHPEISGDYGVRLMGRWLAATRKGVEGAAPC